MNIHEIDLNLLVAFDALMQERNVTRAGERIGLSQPSMSHALTRLRKLCGDPLFVRIRTGMEPTPFAQHLEHSVRAGLATLQAGLAGAAAFRPAESTRTFQIIMNDMGETIYLPPLMAALKTRAPGVNLRVLQLARDRYQEVFESGGADLAIGVLPALQGGFYQQLLFRDTYTCLVRGDHPRIGDALSIQQFAAESHVMIEPASSRYSSVVAASAPATLIERELARHGLQRRIALRVPHFTIVPTIVQTTDLIATVPRHVMAATHAPGNLKMLPAPFEVPRFEVKQFWHQRNHQDAGNRWLRGLIAELFTESKPLQDRLGD